MTFTAQIDAWVKKSEARMTYVAKQASQDTFNEAQTPVFKGGKMRVITGFLRHTGQAAIGSLPVGESVNPGDQTFDWNPESMAAVLLRWDLKSPLFFGWTANYARYRENVDGFMRLAAQNWPKHVDEAVRRAKEVIK